MSEFLNKLEQVEKDQEDIRKRLESFNIRLISMEAQSGSKQVNQASVTKPVEQIPVIKPVEEVTETNPVKEKLNSVSDEGKEKSATQLKKEAKKKEKDEKFKEKLEKKAATASTAKPVKVEEKKPEAVTQVKYTSNTKLGEKKGASIISRIFIKIKLIKLL